jgi:hypothetical protein
MGLISIDNIADGTSIDAADVNTPLNTIVNEINGSLNADNLAANAVTTAKIADGNITNAKLSTTAGELGGAWKSWTPTITGFSANPANGLYYYTLIGKTCHLSVRMPNSGTSNATTFTLSLPFTARTGSMCTRLCTGVDNSGDTLAIAVISSSNYAVATLWKGATFGGAWTNSGAKRINFDMTYEAE